MVLGISSFAYGWAVGLPGKIPANPWTQQNLLDTLQVGDNLPLHSLPNERLVALKTRVDNNIIRLESGVRKLTPEHLYTYLKLAEYFIAPLVRFVIDSDNCVPGVNQIKSNINEFLSTIKNTGIKIGIENHDRLKASELATLMEGIGSSDVDICLDCVNSIGAEEGLEFVARILAPVHHEPSH